MPRVDPNIIDSTSHRYVYDLAMESGQFQACLELEKAFKARSNISEMTKKHLKRNSSMICMNTRLKQSYNINSDPSGSHSRMIRVEHSKPIDKLHH